MTQSQIDDWNKKYPVGSPCYVRYDDGSEGTHKTRSEAWALGSDHVVVKVDGLSGGYCLERLTMVDLTPPETLPGEVTLFRQITK